MHKGSSRPARLVATVLFIALLSLSASVPACAQSAPPGSDIQVVGPVRILTQAPTLLDLGAGIFDLVGNAHRNQTGAVDAELRFGQRWFGIGPAIGTLINRRGGGMAYVGFDSDVAIGPIVVTPLAGFGAWWKGSNRDENLGGTFEFRLSLQAAYAVANGSRLGVRLGHISNANTHSRNPSENDVMATYAFPLGF